MNLLSFLREKKSDSELVGSINKLFEADEQDYSRKMIDRIIFRNLLYYGGEQWLSWIKSAGAFQRRKMPDYAPTPVSNEIRDFVRTVRAMLMGQRLNPSIAPNTNEKEDESAAILGQNLLTWMDKDNDSDFLDEKEDCVDWTIIAGTGFMRCYPEMDSGRWFATKDGILKEGSVCAETVIPFNTVLDPMGNRMHKKRWAGIKSLKDKEWTEDTFKVKIKSSSGDVQTVDYEKKLMKIVSEVSPWKGAGITTNFMGEDGDYVLMREIEFKPTEKYPNGRYVVVCNNQLLVDMPRLIIKSEPGSWFYSLTDFHYNRFPGRFWSDSAINDLISPQNAINEIDQMLSINRKSIGRNRVSYATGTVIRKINEGGTGFLAFEWDQRTGTEPKIMQGTALPTQILEERGIQKGQFQDTAGDPKGILKGQAPSAQSSGVQVDILRETAERSHYPDTDRFNRSLTRVYKKRLLLAQEVYTEPRILKITGKGNKTEIKQFLGSDLRDNTDLTLELASSLSTTRAGKIELLMNMAEKGYLGDLTQDPELRAEFLTEMGLSGFAEKVNSDIARAEKENAQIAMGNFEGIFLLDDEQEPDPNADPNAPPPEPTVLQNDPLFMWDNHGTHGETHRRFLISAQFRDLDEKAKHVATQHTLAHKRAGEMQDEGKTKRMNLTENCSLDRLLPLMVGSEQEQLLSQMGIVADPARMQNPDIVPKIVPSNADKVAEKQIDHEMTQDRERAKTESKLATEEHKHALDTEKVKRNFVVDRAAAEHQEGLDENYERVKGEQNMAIQHVKDAKAKKESGTGK
jgi:hypothetical protein